jgi:ATP-binding cassette, subfamily G (WHITE), member 2, SNQ2
LGIIIAFGVGFIALLLVFSEYNTTLAGATSVMLFKRGARAPIVTATNPSLGDEEKLHPTESVHGATSDFSRTEHVGDAVLPEAQKMDDTFSWRHIEYTVPVSGGEHRKLLDDVSGYVVPGKLTALMGESGAGKTTLLNVLAERTGQVGVVCGERYVNGQALPHDFQAQT